MSKSVPGGPPVSIKGVALKATIEFARKKLGDQGADQLVAGLPDEIRSTLSKGVLASNFYPLPWLIALQDGLARLVGGERTDVLREIGRFAAENALTGVYRIFLKVGSPEYIFGKVGSFFSNYFHGVSSESIRIVDLRKGAGAMQIDAFPGGHVDFCRRLDGYFQRVVELSGGKNVRLVHSKCAWRGEGRSCEWAATWE